MSDMAVRTLERSLAQALGIYERAVRYLHPPRITDLQARLKAHVVALEHALEQAENTPGLPDEFLKGMHLVFEALCLFMDIDQRVQAFSNVLKSLRKGSQALETLYPLRHAYPLLGEVFLEKAATPRRTFLDPVVPPGAKVGLIHVGTEEDPYARGSHSLYVPESYDGSRPWPLVVALHGGYGHGRDFLWMWLREAKSRRFLLLAPSSRLQTWNILKPRYDYDPLIAALETLQSQWKIDRGRMLLTGLSDGATYALACGLAAHSPFTALAPIAGVLPPMELDKAGGKRIFWVHGRHDWMFPVSQARRDCECLQGVGADVRLCVIEDLSHTYPREQNAAILEWFDPALALKEG